MPLRNAPLKLLDHSDSEISECNVLTEKQILEAEEQLRDNNYSNAGKENDKMSLERMAETIGSESEFSTKTSK